MTPLAVHFVASGARYDYAVDTWQAAWACVQACYEREALDLDEPAAWAVDCTEGYGPLLCMALMSLDVWGSCCEDAEALRQYAGLGASNLADLPAFTVPA